MLLNMLASDVWLAMYGNDIILLFCWTQFPRLHQHQHHLAFLTTKHFHIFSELYQVKQKQLLGFYMP